MKSAKLQQQNKQEENAISDNLKAAWDRIRKMKGQYKTENKPVSTAGYESNKKLAEAIRPCYLRSDIHAFTD